MPCAVFVNFCEFIVCISADDEKRQIYDRYGEEGVKQQTQQEQQGTPTCFFDFQFKREKILILIIIILF